MKVLASFSVFYFIVHIVNGVLYNNVTLEPAQRQLYDFKLETIRPVGLLTTSSGVPVEVRDTIQLNSDHLNNEFNLDLQTVFDGERVPERVVHAKGTGAFGYLEVTNDITNYTNADLFSTIGKRTPLFARFSTSLDNLGGSDLSKELKGMAIKFYTEEGNLDLLCLQTPVYLYKDAVNFPSMIHAFKRNPRTNLPDATALWDFLTLRPDTFSMFLWTRSDYGLPNGYRTMDSFAIHTYEISNKKGERHYVRFNFRTEQGLANLTDAQAAAIQGVDLDYFVRDLYNAIARNEFPAWRMEMDVLTLDQIRTLDYDPFDVTRQWKRGTYTTVQIGRLVLDRNPDNFFKAVELSAYNPGNLVPGIPGPVDILFKARRVFYRDTQNYRLGRNHNKIIINKPAYAKTYNRDSKAPVDDNMKDIPNYYPNSYNGPMPYVDETRPTENLLLLQSHTVDFEAPANFYNEVLQNDAQRQRLVNTLVTTLVPVNPPVQERGIKMLYLIDPDLGKRTEIALKAAIINSRTNQAR